MSATNSVTIDVVTTSEAVQALMVEVVSRWPRSKPLVATLSAALASLERGNVRAAGNELRAFQNKVRAQVARMDAALANELINAAQQIIEEVTNH